MSSLLYDMVFDYTIRNVTLGSLVLGTVSGALGTFALLRKQSLLGDSISHASLPGVALAFLLTLSKAPFVMLLGAAIAGWLGTLVILLIVRHTRIDNDGAQGIILSVFFGFGLVLLTYIQKLPTASQAGLDKFLFGQAATLMAEDVLAMCIVGGIALTLMFLFWKEIKLMTFDPTFGESLGFSRRFVDILVTTLIVLAIVIGLQTVGVVLMSAMIVAPAASARQWTDRTGVMVFLSALFGALSGVIGSLISSSIEKLPTGPVIVLVITAIMVFSLLFSPHRGMLNSLVTRIRNRKNFAQEGILIDLYKLGKLHDSASHLHPLTTIAAVRPKNENTAEGLRALKAHGYLFESQNRYGLTENGIEHAKKLASGGYHGN
jgi:manganese/zinc/iron transport system permease protein